MQKYEVKNFNLPETLQGLSAKQIEVHLGLYAGYVAHVNKLREQLKSLQNENGEYSYAITETRRRFGFEFNGMRLHEYYFAQLEGGAKKQDESHGFVKAVADKYGSWQDFISHINEVAMSRGIGWTIVYWDNDAQTPHTAWVSDHELGVLAGVTILFAIDMWEHAFMVDYTPAEKQSYINAYLDNVNWSVVQARFDDIQQ